MTTASKITIFRVILVPIFLVLAYQGLNVAALAVFIIASLSDFADGYIARHFDQISDFGKFMDPLADKMLVVACMCYFVQALRMPGWVLAIVCFREFAVSGLRLIAVEKKLVIAAGWSGKIKTASTMIGLCLMLLIDGNATLDLIISIIILITTVYSGVEYFINNKSVFKEN